jgi:large subunit ribosomal protein L16
LKKKKSKHIESFFNYKSKKFPYYYKSNLNKKFKITYSSRPLNFGSFCLRYTGTTSYIKVAPLKSCIRVLKFFFRKKKISKLVFKVNLSPDIVLTCKPKEVRMGKGKGPVSPDKVAILKSGQILFEVFYIEKKDFSLVFKILKICSSRLPYKNKVIGKFW